MAPNRPCDQCGKPLPPEGRFCAHCGFHSGGATGGADPEETTRLGPWERILERLKVVTAGRYDVQRLLGWGGMAGVYLAEELRLKRRVAIKVIAPGLLMDPSQIERFEQEARTTAQLNHPNIVTIYEVDEREDLHYFTMTYVPGRTLGQVMAEASAPLPVGVVEAWVRQVAGALSYAHQRGVVHRDIKPGNILLDEHGSALVGDFGIAKVAEEPGLTRTGMLVGTPAYMSPEQCTTGKVTGASDQYSLGAVAYQMIAGTAPFVGTTIQVIQAHVGDEPRDVREWRPDCPDALAEAVMRMLAKSADDRWPSLYDAVDALGGTTLRHDDPRRDTMASLAAWTHAVRIGPPSGGDEEGRSHLEVGESLRLEAATLDYRGEELPDRNVEWSATPEGIVEVDEEGVVRGVAVGKARVRAASGRVASEWVFSVGSAVAETLTPASGIEAALVNPPVPSVTTPPEPDSLEERPAVEPVSPPTPEVAALDPTPPSEPQSDAADRDADGEVDWIEEAEFDGVASDSDDGPTPAEIPGGRYSEVMSAAAAGLPSLPEDSIEEALPAGGIPSAPAGTPDTSEGVEPPESTGGARRRLPLVAGLAGLATIVAVVAFAVGGGSSGGPPPPEVTNESTDGGGETRVVEGAGGPEGGGAVVGGETGDPDGGSGDPEGGGTEGPPPEGEGGGDDPGGDPGAGGATGGEDPAGGDDPEGGGGVVEPPPPPRPATVRVLGDLPVGTRIRIRGEGVDRVSTDLTLRLAPGRYTLEARAEGFEPAETQLNVAAASTRDWRPVLAPVPVAVDPEPDSVVSGEGAGETAAARETAIVAALQSFAVALESRDPARLREAWPTISGEAEQRWNGFLTSSAIRNVRATARVSSVPGAGDTVEVPFVLALDYEVSGGASPPPQAYRATVERVGERWVIRDLVAGN